MVQCAITVLFLKKKIMKFDVYTLIAYRANGTDICHGCIIGQSVSEHKIIIAEDLDKISSEWAKFKFEDKYADREYCHWEITILRNGMCINGYVDIDESSFSEDGGGYDVVKSIEAMVDEYLKGMVRNHEEEVQRKKEDAIRSAEERTRAKELEEYNRLKSKFGGS